MQCPVDGTTLVMTDRSGVEIDYCPSCRGVWLDRGELDKIIERSTQMTPPPPPPTQAQRPEPRGERYHQEHDQRTPKRRKKEGFGDFLGDIFDF
ncbi:MAG: zf-TFIIB domain-containing protein [Pseudomonadota bacterium]